MSVAAQAILFWMATSVLADGPLESAADYVARGMQRFRARDIAGSIRDFQEAAELDPRAGPHLWQLGISYYYAGDFQKGRRQFESHRAVNPHDVENAAWHFLCVAAADGVAAARKSLIEIDTARDTRVPMGEVYRFYAGRGSEEAVTKAAEEADSEQARMCAHLYLGLFYEVAGETAKARDHTRKAAAAKLRDHCMHDVAKVHLGERKWDRKEAESGTAAGRGWPR
jgi:lipoprotein NlpI